ncbi:MAG: Osmosensitive channel His kinase sensor domain [Bryobacterales bacterium]|nr:Osmosensitive channel His kinase sensor domain [Bryobacterales bacterium]
MPSTPPRRPDPEQLLRRVQAEEEEAYGARLKVFLGYSSGVGKSFRMLDEGRRRKSRGQDVVVGALQPKASPEVEVVLRSLEVIPLRYIDGLPTMDMDAILRRRPAVCLVDGLAWDNPPGGAHQKRWQDVEQLLSTGISVITTINLQYIEERREQVEHITGKHVTQTVPLKFISQADEIVIVDAPAEADTQLSELREIALVLTADVIDRQLEAYLKQNGIVQYYGTQERIMVCVTPRANAARMIESGKRSADRFHGDLIVAYVSQPELSAEDKAALDRNLALARDAGAQIEMLDAEDPIDGILQFAQSRGITQIFVGHSLRRTGFGRFLKSPVDRLLEKPKGIDVRVFPH